MKLGLRLTGILMGLFLVAGMTRAQQQTGPAPAPAPAVTHLRVDLVLMEYEGEKKISSLPYTLYIGVAPEIGNHFFWQSLRMGVRVPIATGPSAVSSAATSVQFSYQDLGTDIDCGAAAEADGRYRIEAKIDRSSIYAPNEGESGGDRSQMNVVPHEPIIRHFNSGFDLRLRDGETGEGISATDPFNGHVLKVSVTIHVVK